MALFASGMENGAGVDDGSGPLTWLVICFSLILELVVVVPANCDLDSIRTCAVFDIEFGSLF